MWNKKQPGCCSNLSFKACSRGEIITTGMPEFKNSDVPPQPVTVLLSMNLPLRGTLLNNELSSPMYLYPLGMVIVVMFICSFSLNICSFVIVLNVSKRNVFICSSGASLHRTKRRNIWYCGFIGNVSIKSCISLNPRKTGCRIFSPNMLHI